VCARAVGEVSGFAFERAAVAFTANGQSIIVEVGPKSTAPVTEVDASLFDLTVAFAEVLETVRRAPCLAQQS
jgi:hypothetical protein